MFILRNKSLNMKQTLLIYFDVVKCFEICKIEYKTELYVNILVIYMVKICYINIGSSIYY